MIVSSLQTDARKLATANIVGEALVEQAVVLRMKAFGAKHLRTANALFVLAEANRTAGELDKSLTRHLQVGWLYLGQRCVFVFAGPPPCLNPSSPTGIEHVCVSLCECRPSALIFAERFLWKVTQTLRPVSTCLEC